MEFFLNPAEAAVTKCFITSAPGQETSVTVEWSQLEPGIQSSRKKRGRGIHVIQENSKENVIMCRGRPSSSYEQNTDIDPRDSPGFINIIQHHHNYTTSTFYIQFKNY